MPRTNTGLLTDDLAGRWNAARARTALAAWRRSGLSLAAFAALWGVTPQRLSWWRKRLSEGAAPRREAVEPEPLAFLPAVVTTSASPPRVTVRLARGVEIDAAETGALPAEWIAALVRELTADER